MIRDGVLAAVLVALSGFGVLLGFALLGGPVPSHLPDLFAFWSATVGDGLLLPMMAFAAVSAAGGFHAPSAPRLRVAVPLSLAAVTLAVWTQYSWLADPAPALNWTLPRPHTFTAAGWYHAGFFVAYSGFLAFFAALAWCRLRAADRIGPAELLFGAAGAAFIWLWLLDGGVEAVWCVFYVIIAMAAYAVVLATAVVVRR